MRHARRGGIYAIVNTATGAQYFGSTTRFSMRRWAHFRMLRQRKHHCAHLQAAWNKYGGDRFEFRVLAVLEKSELRDTEQRWLDRKYGAEECYNTSMDAEAPMRGRKMPRAAVEAKAAKLRGIPRPPEVVAKMSASKKGAKPPPQTIEAVRRSNRERERTPEYRAGVARRFVEWHAALPDDKRSERAALTKMIHLGRRRSDTTRKRISESKKGVGLGRKVSDETRAKMSAAQKGRTVSAEHRAKIRQALLGRKLAPDTLAKVREIGAARRGTKMDPDAVARSAAARRGQKRSPEARAKMSAAAKARYKRERVALQEKH